MSKFFVMVFEAKEENSEPFKRSMMAAGGQIAWEGDHRPLVVIREPKDKGTRLEADPRRSRPL